MFALLTLAVLTSSTEGGEEGGAAAAGFTDSVHIAPFGWALIFAGSFVALLLVTMAFRSTGKRH